MQASSIEDVKLATSGGGDDDVLRQAQRQLAALRARRRLLQVLMVQDLADSLIALQEIVGACLHLMQYLARNGSISLRSGEIRRWAIYDKELVTEVLRVGCGCFS